MAGPYIKSKNNKLKTLLNILITTIPLIIYNLFIFKLEGIVSLIVSVVSIFIIHMLIDSIKDKKSYSFKNSDVIYHLTLGIIIWLLIPKNTNIISILTINVLAVLINTFIKQLNPIAISSSLIYFIFNLRNLEIIPTEYNLFITIPIFIIIITYLILTKSIKYKITIPFLIINIVYFIIFNIDISSVFIIGIIGIYVITEFYSTPTTTYAQIISGIILGIVSIFLPITWFLGVIIFIGILNHYLDLKIAIILSEN